MTSSTHLRSNLVRVVLSCAVAAMLPACGASTQSGTRPVDASPKVDSSIQGAADWTGPGEQAQLVQAGDPKALGRLHRLMLRSQLTEAIHVLSITGQQKIDAKSIQDAGLIFLMPVPHRESMVLRSEGNSVVVNSPDFPAQLQLDVETVLGKWAQSGARQNYRSGIDLRIDRAEAWKVGAMAESVAANGLMWESDQLEERRAWAFLAVFRHILPTYASSHGKLPKTIDAALSELQLTFTPAAFSPPLLPVVIEVDESGTAVRFQVETPIGAKYSEICVLRPGMTPDTFFLETAGLEEFQDRALPSFTHTLFTSTTKSSDSIPTPP